VIREKFKPICPQWKTTDITDFTDPNRPLTARRCISTAPSRGYSYAFYA
jgi:hypothetical protein